MGLRKSFIESGFRILGATQLHRMLAPAVQGMGAILTFHRVRPSESCDESHVKFAPNAGLEITPDFLDQLLSWLAKRYEIIDLDTVVTRITHGGSARKFVSLTFDDGYRDTLDIAAPVMMRHKLPFTVFVTSGFADRTARLWWVEMEAAIAALSRIRIRAAGRDFDLPAGNATQKQAAFEALYWPLRAGPEAVLLQTCQELCAVAGIDSAALTRELCLDWDGLRQLAACPQVTFGAHTLTHPMLARHDQAFATREMKDCRTIIEQATDCSIRHFSYPVGDPGSAGPREFSLARSLGYASAVTTRPGMIFPGHKNHLTALPRLSVNGFHQTLPAMDMLLSGTPTFLWNRGRRIMAS